MLQPTTTRKCVKSVISLTVKANTGERPINSSSPALMRGGLYGKIKPLLLIRRIMEMQNGKTGDRRVVNTVQGLKEDFAWHLRYTLAKYD